PDPRPKKQSAGLFFAPASPSPGFQVLDGPLIKKCPGRSRGIFIGGPSFDLTHALKNSPQDCFLRRLCRRRAFKSWMAL
ncbi:MAG TPA: hypothetical protein H9860_01090, partial [Candidatus Gemmiger faecavium]|nr:hypothetical protein [Candidatus Gemmiger faecavium]